MLLNEIEANNDLNCPQCKDTYVRPKLLPCGHSLCSYCIKVTALDLSNEFKCLVCKKVHSLPEDGFPTNEKLTNKLNKTFAKQKEKFNQYKSFMDSITAKLKQTEFELENKDYVITEYCSELKRQVQLAKELKFKELDDLSDEMMAQIDSFQKEKLNAILEANRAAFDSQLREMKEDLEKFNKQLDTLNVYNDRHTTLCIQSQLATLKEKFYNILFEDKSLEFHAEENKSSFGHLSLKNHTLFDLKECDYEIDLLSHVINIKESVVLEDYFEEFFLDNDWDMFNHNEYDPEEYISTDYVHFNDKSYVVFFYLNGYEIYENNKITCLVYDANNTLMNEKTLEVNYNTLDGFKSNGEKILFLFSHNQKKYLSVLDKELNELVRAESDIDFDYILDVNDSFIIATNEDTTLKVYDWSLDLVKVIGQKTKPTKPFYFPYAIIGFKSKNNCFYILETHDKTYENFLRIVNEKGQTLELFPVESEILLHIDSENRLIFLHEGNFKFIYMSQKGHVLKELKIKASHLVLNWENWTVDKNDTLHGHVYVNQGLDIRKASIKSFKL